MDAEQALRELLQRAAQDHHWEKDSIKIEPINSGGANYTSALFLASATSAAAAPAAARKDKLFAKTAIFSEKMLDNMEGMRFYELEKYVYTKLIKIYQDMEDEHQLAPEERMYFPKLYAYSDEQFKETMVLEDLTASGYGMFDRLKPVTWEYAESAITELAKWHALSMAYEAQQPEEFAKAAEFLQFKPPKKSPEAVEWLKTTMASTLGVTREEHRPVMMAYLPRMMEAYGQFNSPISRPVFAHGDYRVSNLMHRRRDGKLQIVPVDYQTVHTGCPASDLIYFITTGTDHAFRELHYKNLVEHYYRQLGLCLQRLGNEVGTIYPREDFEKDMKTLLPLSLMLATVVLPLCLVDAESAPSLSGDGFQDFAVRPSTVYAERLNGLLDDLVAWKALDL